MTRDEVNAELAALHAELEDIRAELARAKIIFLLVESYLAEQGDGRDRGRVRVRR